MSSTSGSPNADAPTEYDFEGIPCGTFKLNFGSNFLSNKNESDYHILKFDIKPPTSRGNAYINFDSNDSLKLTIPTDEPENNAIYKGTVSQVKNGKECLLLFDGENLRIEKVSSMMHAKHVRCEKGEDEEEYKPQIIVPEKSTTTNKASINPSHPKLPSFADDEVSDGEASSDDDDEQLLLEQIANSTQPPSNPESIKSKLQTPPVYNPSSQASSIPSPPRTNSSTTYHSSPASSLIPTPPSKNSSLLEDLMMSDSDDSDSDSSGEDEAPKPSTSSLLSAAMTSKPNIPEPMDYTMNNLQRPSSSSFENKPNNNNDNIRNAITGGGFNLLSSDLQLSESSSDEDMD